MKLKEKFENLRHISLIFDAPMGEYTTYKTGGAAQVLALPQNADELKEIIDFASANKIIWRVLGLGSNILVGGRGAAGITVCLKNLKGCQIKNNLLVAAGGEALDNVIAAAANAGLEGLENLSGIPGSCGGAVFMNAGAFGSETFDFLKSFEVLTASGGREIINKSDVKYSYRKVHGLENCIILNAVWELKPARDKAALQNRRAEILKQRAQKQPLDYPSAGSVFKRPQNNFASALIDKCGLKGLREGGAMVSPKHAGFIINYDNATPADIKNLIAKVQAEVFAKTSVKLELEQILWGEF